jgi:hypothetical protein
MYAHIYLSVIFLSSICLSIDSLQNLDLHYKSESAENPKSAENPTRRPSGKPCAVE